MVTFLVCFFPLFVDIRSSPKVASFDQTIEPRCTLWHGWFPGLTARPTGSPWAVAAGDLACRNLESPLAVTLSAMILHPLWDDEDAQDMAEGVPDQPISGQTVAGNLFLTLILKLLERESFRIVHPLSMVIFNEDMRRTLMATLRLLSYPC